MRQKLEDIANKIVQKTDLRPTQNFGSVLIILSIISIVLTIIRIIQECNKSELSQIKNTHEIIDLYSKEIKALSSKRGFWTKMRIKKLIRKELPPDLYEQYHLSLTNSIIEYGQNITNEDIKTLLEGLYYG